MPTISRNRLIAALAVAAFADAIQVPITVAEATGIATAPALFLDFVLDATVCVIISRLVGFHWMLLPTFFIEAIPGIGLLPTWLGCTFFVLRLRKKQERTIPPPMMSASPPPLRAASAVIDIN